MSKPETPDSCPNCGYCHHCGQAKPVVPQQPIYIQPVQYPWHQWPTVWTSSNTNSIG
jgi:hypothetical protein